MATCNLPSLPLTKPHPFIVTTQQCAQGIRDVTFTYKVADLGPRVMWLTSQRHLRGIVTNLGEIRSFYIHAIIFVAAFAVARWEHLIVVCRKPGGLSGGIFESRN